MESALIELRGNMVSSATMSAYRRSWDNFSQFYNDYIGGNLSLPISIPCLTLFIAFLHGRGFSPPSIASCMSAIAYLHKLRNLPDPTKSFVVSKLIWAAKNLRAQPDIRLPVTKEILHKLLVATPRVTSSHYKSVMFQTALVLGFNAFLRIGEMLPSSKSRAANCLHLHDLIIQSDGLILSFRRFKSSNTQGSQTLRLSAKTSCCPRRIPRRYCGILLGCCPLVHTREFLAVRGTAPGLLFCYPCGSPFLRREFDNTLKRALSFCGLDSSRFKGHSLRIGAATQSAIEGKSDAYIRAAGRWASDAFRKYIRIS
ncbi:uncharacterized protein LOC135489991 [Lineus longissimus]|uniref:uncharacterized protein LOC135489991 n=1 Tax=Lineus longissimus TaxID=88925 RepID=UPI00315C6407